MELILKITLCFVLSCAAGGAVLAVFPEGGTRKTLKTAVLAFAAACSLSPITALKSGGYATEYEPALREELSSAVEWDAAQSVKEQIEKAAVKLLSENGAECDGVSAAVVSENGSVFLEGITVFAAPEQRERAAELIEKNFGIKPDFEE